MIKKIIDFFLKKENSIDIFEYSNMSIKNLIASYKYKKSKLVFNEIFKRIQIPDERIELLIYKVCDLSIYYALNISKRPFILAEDFFDISYDVNYIKTFHKRIKCFEENNLFCKSNYHLKPYFKYSLRFDHE